MREFFPYIHTSAIATTQSPLDEPVASTSSLTTPSSPIRLQHIDFFGRKMWAKYFGDVGAEPSLPPNIIDQLEAPCPIFPDRCIRDTHTLVLIPGRLNGHTFNINRLEYVIKNVLEGPSYTWRTFDSLRFANVQAHETNYWILACKEYLPKELTPSKWLTNGQVNGCEYLKNMRYKHPYRIPAAIEAATIIATQFIAKQEVLFNNYVYCREADIFSDHPWGGKRYVVAGWHGIKQVASQNSHGVSVLREL